WGISSHYLYKDNGLAINWVHVISTNIVNEVTVGARHDQEGFIPSDGVIPRLSRVSLKYTAPQLFPENNRLGTIPRVTGWSSVAGRPANINWLDRWGEIGQDYILPSVADNITINRGNHTYKPGLYFERLINTEAAGGNWSGTFNFGTSSSFTASLGNTGYAYANALIGDFNSYTESSSRPHTNLEMNLFQWYAQDSWKVTRSFTLNYGLRVGYHSQWYQRDKLASSFDPLRYNTSNAVALFEPFCTTGTPPPGTKCAAANQRARNPVTGTLSTNTSLIGTVVPGVGDPNNGLGLLGDGLTPAGFKDVQPIDLE